MWFLPVLIRAQGTYYNSIDTGSTGFVTELHTLIYPHTQISYDQFDETNIANFASRDTTGGEKVVTCVYSGENYVYTPPFTWLPFSREHTFCHSWMPTYNSTSGKEYSDQHHLFPTNQNNANAVRSNHPLGIVINVSSTYLQAKFGTNGSGQTVYEPRDTHKGDAARALLYMAVCYNGVSGNDWSFNYLNSVTLPALSEAPQNVDLLVQWHNQDPPDQWEKDRNEYIYSIQGNRNPFIDHPEYVSVIDFNTLTKKTSGSTTPSGGNISITSLTFSYIENFDLMANSGTGIAWTDTVTVNGWYANRSTYSAGTGSVNSGALYSFGSESASARSLGSVSSGTTGTIFYAVRFINNSGSTITSIPLSYTGRQWRNGGNATVQKLMFEYKINASSINDAGTWTAVPALDFTSPVATATAAALDGNLSANKTDLAATISLVLQDGDEIWFRWTDINDAGSDHGLSVDDFTLNVNGVPMPVELTTFTAIVKGDKVELAWKTATELNNHGFEIERRAVDGLQSTTPLYPPSRGDRGVTWDKIGLIAGNGTTNSSKEYSFIDRPSTSARYEYRLKQIDRDGKFQYSNSVEANISIAHTFVLAQNYPNPFNPSTSISYYIPIAGEVRLLVYDMLGKKVESLVNREEISGEHRVQFNAKHLPSGIYFYTLHTNNFTSTKRMSLVK